MPLRLAVFDFDLTLTIHHVFYALSGARNGTIQVPPPHAKTEYGQLVRLGELDASQTFAAQGGFALAVLGGPGRVAELRNLLEDLHRAGVECVICSKSLVGSIRRILGQAGLLQYFTKVYANVADVYGANDYDRQVRIAGALRREDEQLIGTPDLGGWSSKQQLIARCLHERGLSGNEAVFVDDTPQEVQGVQDTCGTILVQPPQGMGPREFGLIRQLTQGAAAMSGPKQQRLQGPPSGAWDQPTPQPQRGAMHPMQSQPSHAVGATERPPPAPFRGGPEAAHVPLSGGLDKPPPQPQRSGVHPMQSQTSHAVSALERPQPAHFRNGFEDSLVSVDAMDQPTPTRGSMGSSRSRASNAPEMSHSQDQLRPGSVRQLPEVLTFCDGRHPFGEFGNLYQGHPPFEYQLPACSLRFPGYPGVVWCESAEKAIVLTRAAMLGDSAAFSALCDCKDAATCRSIDAQMVARHARDPQWERESELWERSIEEVAITVIWQKITSSPQLSDLLLSTRDSILAEASDDQVWGVGLGIGDSRVRDPRQWRGRNLLGRALERARDGLLFQRQQVMGQQPPPPAPPAFGADSVNGFRGRGVGPCPHAPYGSPHAIGPRFHPQTGGQLLDDGPVTMSCSALLHGEPHRPRSHQQQGPFDSFTAAVDRGIESVEKNCVVQ